MTLHSVALNCCFVADVEAVSQLSSSLLAADLFGFNTGTQVVNTHTGGAAEGARKTSGWRDGRSEEDTAVKAAECERIVRQKFL